MPRKRKIPLQKINEENHVNELGLDENANSQNLSLQNGPIYNIMSNVQLCETFHNKYIKETQELYKNMDHDAFMFTFTKMVKSAMHAEENNEYGYITLLFCAKYVSSYQGESTHPVLLDIFKWITATISNNPHIRYRLCQFVNIILRALGPEAALDDSICDKIMSYMIGRLSDINPNVRLQAILALQRLQNPDNPDDIILKTYQFHLSSDPSPKVRMAVITSIGRNFNTIPYILERLWDNDEKVRRHTYLNMSSYPVRSYKVAQRLTFLEQGLNDRSDMVKKVVSSVMLPQWLESYNKNYIDLIFALKLDSNESEMERFRKTAKLALKEMFKKADIEELIECLPIERDDLENEYYKCVTNEKLKIEVSIYWICLIEHLQRENADEIDMIIPELSTFCCYILKFCESRKFDNDEDKWRKMENQYILLGLIEIVHTFDLGDEIGRENLKQLLATLLKNYDINGKVVEMIVRCAENLIPNQEDRLQFFVDIIKEITGTRTGNLNEFLNNRNFIDELLDKNQDINLKLQVTSLRVKILDFEEQERNYVDKKDYVKAQKITEEKSACHDEYINLLKPLLNQVSNSEQSDSLKSACLNFQQSKKVTTEDIIKSLQISFYMIASKKVSSLTPNVCELYKIFIRRHIESNTILVRNWALKCGTCYSLLYDQLAKDVYSELYTQFFKNQNIYIWNTAIDCMFELIDRYGFEHFENADKQNKNKNRRQLYNTLEFLDVDEDVSSNSSFHVDVIFMMSHILDTCEHVCILRAIIKGMCRLVLHGHIKNDDILEKLLLKYFNPATESEINQILGMFYRNLIVKKKQEYLQHCLLPTINTILTAPYDSPLHEIKPETVIKFVVDATRPQFCSNGLNIHNTIALSFMQEMQSNINNKELIKIISKELLSLEVAILNDSPLRNDLDKCCAKLLENELDTKVAKNIRNFRDVLNGNYKENVRPTQNISDEDDDESDHETQATTETAPSIITNSVTNPSEPELQKDNEPTKEIQNENNIEKPLENENKNERQNNETDAQTLTDPNPKINEKNPKIIIIENIVIEKLPQLNEINTQNLNEINTQNLNESIINVNANTEVENVTGTENTIMKETNLTQNVSSVIPPLVTDNSTPRKTMIGKKNETANLSAVNKSPSNTPTLFGRDNNTSMRYLRKSWNFRQSSHDNDDGPTMPPKIRIEAKMQANVKGIQEVPQPLLKKITPNNKGKQKRTSNNRNKNDSITQNKENDKNISKNNSLSMIELEHSLNDEDIIPPSPTIESNKNIRKQTKNLQITSKEKKTEVTSDITKKLDNSISSTLSSTKTPTRFSARVNKKNLNKLKNTLGKSNEPKTPEKSTTKNKVTTKKNTDKSKSTNTSKTKSRLEINNGELSPQEQENLIKSTRINTRSTVKKDNSKNATRKRLFDNEITACKEINKERVSRIPIKNKAGINKEKITIQIENNKTKLDVTSKNNEQNESRPKTNEKNNTNKKYVNLNNNKISNLPVRLKSNRLAQK